MEAQKDTAAKNEGLDELLDSCLSDFDQPIPKTSSCNAQSSSSSVNIEAKETEELQLPDSSSWGEEFKQFQDVMENFLENESDLNELRNLMGNLTDNSPLTDSTFDQTFVDTIKGLTEGAQNIPEMSPEALADIFSNFDMNDSSQAESDQLPELMPLMHNVMQKLMSKELLYPSLKEIVDKYPDWLSEKHSSLNPQEYERYNQQFNLMKNVCEEFEREGDDSEEVKKERFEKVLMLMQKIQNCGNPPKELVSDIGQNIPLDEHGNLSIPGMPQQCSIM